MAVSTWLNHFSVILSNRTSGDRKYVLKCTFTTTLKISVSNFLSYSWHTVSHLLCNEGQAWL